MEQPKYIVTINDAYTYEMVKANNESHAIKIAMHLFTKKLQELGAEYFTADEEQKKHFDTDYIFQDITSIKCVRVNESVQAAKVKLD